MASLISLQGQGVKAINDQHLKYQEVVVIDGKSREILLGDLKKIVFKIYDSMEIKTVSDYQIFVESDFKIFNMLIGKLGNPAGKVDFKLAVEVKDNKFRYSLYDFFFTPMERDRYGRHNLAKQEPMAVNEQNYEGNKTLLKKIKDQSKAYAGKLEDALQEYLMIAYAKEKEW